MAAGQQGISAATAAVQGLAGGSVKVALAGGSAPYLAEVIHHQTMTRDAKGKDVVNVQANLIAHAVLGAVVAQASGNNALSGASGAVAGEYIAQQLYPGVNRNALSEEERQTISALGTLAAGLAGGLAGHSTGSAVAGAQAGKNAVENNNLGSVLGALEAHKKGTINKYESGTQAAIKEACNGGTPVSCEMAVAAMGTVLSGGVLPEAMVVSGIVSTGAVSGVDYFMTGTVDPKNAIAAYWVGALTRYTGFKTTMVINSTGGAATNYLDGKNPWTGGLVSGLTGAAGYGIGSKVVEPVMDKAFNPVWKNLGWEDIGMGISKPVESNFFPSIASAVSGTSGGEYLTNKANEKIEAIKNNDKENKK